MSLIDRLRFLLSPTVRGYLHGLTPLLMSALVVLGYATDTTAAVVAGGALAVVDLLFALVNSTSAWRTALYSFAAALQPVGVLAGLGTNAQWAAVLAVAASLLGSGVAAAKTPAPVV